LLAHLHRDERRIAEALQALNLSAPPWGSIEAAIAIPWVEQRLALELAASQKGAVEQALSSKVLVITGGPGVGKTTLINAILRIMAAKVHRMSVVQAEEFYGPVRKILREKMKNQVAERAAKVLTAEFSMEIPADVKAVLTEHLGPLLGDEQFNQIIKFMTGCYPPTCAPQDKNKDGPSKCLALVYGGAGAVEKIRNLLGATDPNKAQTGSVRREFGLDVMVNAAHASDSVENAEREIGIIKMEENHITPWVRKYYGD